MTKKHVSELINISKRLAFSNYRALTDDTFVACGGDIVRSNGATDFVPLHGCRFLLFCSTYNRVLL